MRRFLLIILVLLLWHSPSFALDNALSKQAVAFYSDNNFNKTMDLILQINESDRTAQDWLILGNVLEDKGEQDNAIFMYKKAIVVNPKYYKAYYNLANHYLKNAQYHMALDNYKKAASLNKQNPYIFYNMACCYIQMGEIKKAKSPLNKAIMFNNNVPEFHYNLAFVYHKLAKENLAQTYLDNYNKLTENL